MAESFESVPTELDFPKHERKVLEFWKRERIIERAIAGEGADGKDYVFYEGPPTANGIPHNGHVLTRVMKDLSLIHISEPTRQEAISYAVFCL